MATFGESLWSNLACLEVFTQDNTDHLHRLNDFVKKRAAVETEYAKSLSKLVDGFKLDKKKKKPDYTTVYETWTNILDQTERIGNAHQQAAETLENEVHSLIKDTIKNYETERKKQFSDVKQLKTDLKKTLEQHEKVKKSYEDACKAADAAKAVFEKADSDRNVTKAFVDKTKQDWNLKTVKASEADDSYQKSTAAVNIYQEDHYKNVLPNVLNSMQETDSKRIEAVKSVYSKLTGTFLNVTPEETDALSSALSSSENINGKIELESFIDHHKLAEAYPGAIPYENYWGKLRSTSSVKKIAPKESEEDQLGSLPPDKALKKASKKLAELDKEIPELIKKRSGVETLLEAYMSQPGLADERAIREAKIQKADLEQKIDIARIKKYKLEVFVAQAESRPAPAMPVLFNESTLSASLPSAKSILSKASEDNLATIDPLFGKVARALYNYAGNAEQHEIDLTEGEVVTIIHREGHWFKVKNARAESGFVPENYLDLQ